MNKEKNKSLLGLILAFIKQGEALFFFSLLLFIFTVNSAHGSVINGDFETGDLSDWTVTAGGTSFPTVQTTTVSGGTYAVHMGDGGGGLLADGGMSTIEQTYTIPASATSAELSMQYNVVGNDGENYDWMRVYVNGVQISSWFANTAGWQTFSYDLSSFIGSTITLTISSWTSDPVASVNYYLDDVIISHQSGGGSGNDNGDFETGDLSSWAVTAGGASYPTVQATTVYGGTYSVHMGDGGGGLLAEGGTATIERTYTIPALATSAELSMKYNVVGNDGENYDWMRVYINGVQVESWFSDTAGWQTFSHDLSSFIGSTITLKISSWTRDPVASVNYYLDDVNVSYQSGGGSPISEAVDNSSLNWTTSGNADWTGQTEVFFNGGDAAKSGIITHYESSWLEATVTGPGTLTFFWKVSSEGNFDFLRFYIDGVEQAGPISGEVDWQQKNYFIGPGSHTIKWAYTKDGSMSSGADTGWLDFVEFSSAANYNLTVNKSGTGNGSVTSSPLGIDCGLDCSEAYGDGIVVALTAVPDAGSTFVGWSGGSCSGTGPCFVTMMTDTTVTATFDPVPDITPPIVISVDPAKMAVDVARGSMINAVFSEPLNPATINNFTFYVNDGAVDIPGTVSYNNGIASFVPQVLLDYGTTYTVTIKSDVQDLAGNFMTNDYIWYFTTQSMQTVQNLWSKTYGGGFGENVFSLLESSDGFLVTGYSMSFDYAVTYLDAWVVKVNKESGDVIWEKRFGRDFDTYDYGRAIVEDTDGYVVSGIINSPHTQTQDIYSDILVMKLNKADGGLLWQKTYGGSGHDNAYGMSKVDGGYIVVGDTTSFGVAFTDMLVMKIDTQGDVLWEKTFGSAGQDTAYSVTDTATGYVVAGYTDSFGAGDYDFWVLKLDKNTGNVIWENTYGGPSLEMARSVIESSDNTIIVAGTTSSFGGGAGDGWIIKVDSTNGNLIADYTYGLSAQGWEHFKSIRETTGAYIVTGTMNGGSYTDTWTLKIDKQNGSVLWEKKFGEDGKWEYSEAVIPVSGGGYLVGGETGSFGIVGGDLWLMKMDENGVISQTCPLEMGQDTSALIEIGHNVSVSSTGVTGINQIDSVIPISLTVNDTYSINNGQCSGLPGSQADLITSSVDGPNTSSQGDMASVTYSVSNQGTETATFFDIGLYLSTDSSITSSDINLCNTLETEVLPGQTKNYSFDCQIPPSLSDGSYYWGVIADKGDVIAESDKNNNAGYDPVALTFGPTSPPHVTIAVPAGGSYEEPRYVNLICDDGTGPGCNKIYFTLDGSEPSTSSSYAYSGDAVFIPVDTTFKFFAIDNELNPEPIKTEVYVIDPTPPISSATPLGGAYETPQNVIIDCDDGIGSGCGPIFYTLDGSEPTMGSPYIYSGDAVFIPVDTTLKFFATDYKGNQELMHTEVYVIDPTPPISSATPLGGAYETPQDVMITCDDGIGSGCGPIFYTLDGSEPTMGSPYIYSGDAVFIPVDTTLKFFATDYKGNQELMHTEVYVIDPTPPISSATPLGGAYETPQNVIIDCDDGIGSGCGPIFYTLDGSEPTMGSPYIYSGDAVFIPVDATLKFFATDYKGNQELMHTEVYVIDPTPPISSATPLGGAYETPQNVIIDCDDGIGSGCGPIFYTLDGSEPTMGSPYIYSGDMIFIGFDATLRFFATDNKGNQEAVHTEVYVIQIL